MYITKYKYIYIYIYVCAGFSVCACVFRQTKYYQHQLTLPKTKKYPYWQLFWSAFPHIWSEYEELRNICTINKV